jgi:hypothetical protein
MYEFGRYRLAYEPPFDAIEADIAMSITSEANLPQLVDLFEDFLRATGYLTSGETLQVPDSATPPIDPLTGYFGKENVALYSR